MAAIQPVKAEISDISDSLKCSMSFLKQSEHCLQCHKIWQTASHQEVTTVVIKNCITTRNPSESERGNETFAEEQ